MSATGEHRVSEATEQPDVPVYETLSLAVDSGVATVCLNRPDKANSMNTAMWRELQACFEWLDQEPLVRVAILAGNGKHFCAGIDLTMFGSVVSGIEGGERMEAGRKAEAMRRTL